MPTPLLKTKLYRPQERTGLVVRPRLLEKLDRGLSEGHPLFMISAPAGYGKTTLLAEWLSRWDAARTEKDKREGGARPAQSAWLSLDEQDNDPYRFWRYVTAALELIQPGFGSGAVQGLEASPPPPLPLVLTELLNEIETLPDRVCLVLDDYHVISAAAVHESLSLVLERMPRRLVLCLVTRADPPLPLARMRANRQLTEVRGADLRFTPEEAGVLLSPRLEHPLTDKDLELVVTRTEGWAAGLQLLALSLQGHADPGPVIHAFSGSQHYVLEYLVEQVLNRQPARVLEFLLRTAVLDRLCGALCDAVVQGTDSAAMLASLEHANLFLVPLDEQHAWYRYHQLFRDLLLSRLVQTAPGLVPALHSRAAEWYDRNGFPDNAIEHAFAAKNYDLAAELIEREGHTRWALSDSAFLSMISRLPRELLLARPALGLYHAWLLFISGQVEAVDNFLRVLIPAIPSDASNPEMQAMRSFIDLLLVYIHDWLGQSPPARLPDRRALEFIPEARLAMRNTADVLYALSLYIRGEFEPAEELLMGTVRRDLAAGGTNAIPIAISQTSRMYILKGRLHQGAALCREYLEHVQARGKWRFYLPGNLNVVLGEILREWNDLELAEQEIREGIQANEPWHSPDAIATGQVMLARVQLSKGEIERANESLQLLDRVLPGQKVSPHLQSELQDLRVRLWLAQGRLEMADRWTQQLAPDMPPDFRHEREQITLARVRLAQGRYAEAAQLLARLAQAAEAGGRAGRQIEVQVLKAIALHRLGHTAEAIQELGVALDLARPEGYKRLFLDEGENMYSLLAAFARASAGAEAIYAQELVGSAEHQPPAAAVPGPGLLEPLTPRELEVLQLLGRGMSNQAIAHKLVITVGAVKKHTGNIFGKLGVGSRLQAIVRARELGVLPEDF